MNKTEAITLILKQLDGKPSNSAQQALDDWVLQAPENKATYDNLVQLHQADWQFITPSPSSEFFEQQRAALQHQITGSIVRESRQLYRVRLAAVIALTLVAALFVYFTTSHRLAQHASDHHLSFENESLGSVVYTLEQEYGVPIRLADQKLSAQHISGLFVHEDIHSVLQALSTNASFKVEKHSDYFILKAIR